MTESVCSVHEVETQIEIGKTYFKFIGSNQGNYPYKLGLNTLADNNEIFNTDKQCGPGGLYFTDSHSIFDFVHFGNTLCVVTIPDGAQTVKVGNKWKTDQMVIESMHEFWTVETWEMLLARGYRGDFLAQGMYFFISAAVRRQKLELVKFWHENINPFSADFIRDGAQLVHSYNGKRQDLIDFFASLEPK